jgi:hypothetical protein
LKASRLAVAHHRHRRQRSAKTRAKFLVVLLFAATAAVTWQFARQRPVHRSSRVSAAPAAVQIPPVASQESLYIALRPSRPAYPFSVIPGGVGSAEELRQVAEHDPVVAQHFQGFDYQHAHLVTVSERQSMYVAYRKGDKVYWTRKKIRLHPGETLISDGKIVARTRCGNRVAVAPLGPAALNDVLESDLNQPLFSNEMVTNAVESQPETYAAALPSTTAGVGHALLPAKGHKQLIPLFLLPLAGIPSGSSHTPLAVTPEPGTLILLSSGLAGVYWKSRKARRKQ